MSLLIAESLYVYKKKQKQYIQELKQTGNITCLFFNLSQDTVAIMAIEKIFSQSMLASLVEKEKNQGTATLVEHEIS